MKIPTPFTKKCPQCQKDLYYKTKKLLKVSIKKNRVCNSCSNENKPRRYKQVNIIIKETKQRLPKKPVIKLTKQESIELRKQIYKTSRLYQINQLKGKDHPNYGKKRDQKFREAISKSKLGKPLSEKGREARRIGSSGRKHSEETKRKMRIARLKHIEQKNGGLAPRYNIDACKYFEELEKEHNWNGWYATKNKEYFIQDLGYFVDYYEPNLNMVIEYDEKRHHYVDGNLVDKDIIRMNQIKDSLKCKFLRYSEITKELKEY